MMDEFKNEVPPATNRGAQKPKELGLRSLVDWVQVTFKFAKTCEQISWIFGFELDDFEDGSGEFGYRSSLRKGHITFFYEGHTEEMGVHVRMTGQGCREYEEMDLLTWSDLFRIMKKNGGHFTRLDVAIDDFTPYFTVESLVRRVKRGLCASKFKKVRHMETIKLESGESTGKTLYFGNPSSRLQVRIYEKDWERITKGKELQEDITAWNRVEIQARNERATKIAEFIAAGTYDLGKIIAGILKHYINFLNENDERKARKGVAKFWTKFLGDVEPLKLSEVAPDKTIEKRQEWLDRQVKKTLGMVFYANEENGIHILMDMLHEGMDLIEKDDLRMIDDYQKRRKLKKEKIERLKENVRLNYPNKNKN
jgi:phage replication initiation protein